MTKYIASVKDRETKKVELIEREYDSKKGFETDLRTNGYAVRFISTPEKFDEDCEKFAKQLELKRNVAKAKRDSDKRVKAMRKETVTVELLAFTGMVIGTFEAKYLESAGGYEIETKRSGLMAFDEKTLKQIDAKNPNFANKIRLV